MERGGGGDADRVAVGWYLHPFGHDPVLHLEGLELGRRPANPRCELGPVGIVLLVQRVVIDLKQDRQPEPDLLHQPRHPPAQPPPAITTSHRTHTDQPTWPARLRERGWVGG